MKRFAGPAQKRSQTDAFIWFRFALLIWLSLLAATAAVKAKLNTGDPLDFFTNVASRLLSSEMNVDLTNIEIYPTNHYTPAVNRLLQVTANLYDSTTNSIYPTIFRPCFKVEGVNIYISGYQLVDGPSDTVTFNYFLTTPVSLDDPGGRAAIAASPDNINVYGVPWILGARKGLPNFNEFALQSVSQIARRLQFTRPNAKTFPPTTTNQMLLVTVSNVIAGVEVWNSYLSNHPSPSLVVADGELDAGFAITNFANGSVYIANTSVALGYLNGTRSGITNLPANQWQGYGTSATPNPNSFLVPLYTNVVFIPASFYDQATGRLLPVPDPESQAWAENFGTGLPAPQMSLYITNRIRCMILDGGLGGRVVDYVQLDNLSMVRKLTDEPTLIGHLYSSDPSLSANNIWSTNTLWEPTVGIANQIAVSLGTISSDWGRDPVNQNAIQGFQSFMWPGRHNTNLVMEAPYVPVAENSLYKTWQANDPLVHYTAGDLNYLATSPYTKIQPQIPALGLTNLILRGFYRLTDRYDPWGGNPGKGPSGDPNAYSLAVKDSALARSDDYNFPKGEPLSFATIGRVHRGTPWQTVYLKASPVNFNNWTNWTSDNEFWPGDSNNLILDAGFSVPTKDRDLISLLGPELSTNNPNQQLSINNPDINAWLAALDGLSVQSNSSPPNIIIISSNSPQAAAIAQGVQDTRVNGNLFPAQIYMHLGDVLATPQLTEASPFLNLSYLQTLSAGGLSDEVLESIPSQLLPLLREDSFGTIVGNDGQWLVQFTGNDDYYYAVQVSSDLANWMSVITNQPINGVFSFEIPPNPGPEPQFFRSVLLP